MKKISFVIPCYNSELSLETVVKEIKGVISTRKEYDYEIILVNDCSSDNTIQVIKKLCSDDKKMKGINLSRNFGQPSATLAGLSIVEGDIVAYSDDDGQTPINELFKLIDKLEEGFDIVFGKFKEKKNSLLQNIGSKLNDIMASYLIGKPRNLHFGNFWVCKKYIATESIPCKNPYPYLGGIFLNITKNMTCVPTHHRKRLVGKTTYTFKKMVSLWLNGFTAFSVKPLRIASTIGLITALMGFIFMVNIIANKILHPLIPLGYSSIMSVLLFIGGLIMIMLGLIGEYVGRIYMNINNNPQYIIKEFINKDFN